LPGCAIPERLDAAAAIMHAHQAAQKPLIVHCFAGVERSPLAVAYYLHRFRGHATLEGAYAVLEERRPAVERRTSWLPRTLLPQ
jgi:protein-tyrosine phosphatase